MKKRARSIGVFDSGFGGFAILKEYLKRHPEIEGILSRRRSIRFFSTDTKRFDTFGELFFGKPVVSERARLG